MNSKQDSLAVDVAVLGAGSAGLAAYRAAAAVTDRVVLIEPGPGGTTCARVGCMPSKLLIAAAEAAHAASEAEGFGVSVGPVRVDGARVMERVRRERDRFVGFVQRGVESFPAHHKIEGRGRFLGDHTLEVNGRQIEARTVVIATGSSPAVIPMLQGLGDRLVVNDDVFSWETLPRSVVVFGPGVIGLELGQALHRLGVRVRVFGRGGFVGPLSDPEVREVAHQAFLHEFPIYPELVVKEVQRDGDEVAVTFEEQGQTVTERFEYALAATGRSPNLQGLGLEHTSLALDRRGVPLFNAETMQAGSSSIFLAGDVNEDRPLLHEASDEGKIAGENAARFPDVRPGLRRSRLAVVFSDPQIAMIGQRFADLTDQEHVVGEVSFEDQGRSRVMRQNKGLLHVYAARRGGQLLGAEMVGPRAEHLAHLLAWSHQQKLTIDQMLAMPFYHPVIEEGLRTALRDASAKISR
jgi:dihydrolipoamide dehydrogenase